MSVTTDVCGFRVRRVWLEIRVGAAGSKGGMAHLDGSPFGLVIDPPVASRLPSGAQGALLRDWLPVGLGSAAPRLPLLYRASRDGWAAQGFHGRCNGRGATVTLVYVANGGLCGGYADHTRAYLSSSPTFLFSLQSPAGSSALQMPIPSGHTGHDLVHYAGYRPTTPTSTSVLDSWITALYSGRGGRVPGSLRGIGAAGGAVKRQLCPY